jgi:hypothetical protein
MAGSSAIVDVEEGVATKKPKLLSVKARESVTLAMRTYDEEDEGLNFTSKLKTLQHVAIDLSAELEAQNNRIMQLEPSFQSSLSRIMSSIAVMRKSDPRRFRAWMYFIFGGLGLSFLFFILFIAS